LHKVGTFDRVTYDCATPYIISKTLALSLLPVSVNALHCNGRSCGGCTHSYTITTRRITIDNTQTENREEKRRKDKKTDHDDGKEEVVEIASPFVLCE